MKRFMCTALAVVLLSSCKVERTPQEFIDPRDPVTQLRERNSDALNAGLQEIRVALERGEAGALFGEFEFDPDVFVVTDLAHDAVRGPAEVQAALQSFITEQGPVRLNDAQVMVGPGGSSAWFRSQAELLERPDEPTIWVTGLLTRSGDEWRLVQAHLSRAGASPDQPTPAMEGR